MSRRVVPVSTLVHYIQQHMEADPVLHGVMIEGEISNFRRPASGHWYFSLKDDRASIPAVMFAAANRKLSFQPRQGDKVIVIGDVTVYEAEGRMQMMISGMKPSGIGDLYLRLEALKKKLSEEGIFAAEHKKPIPSFAMDLALVTGNNTAAREDVLITLHRRWPAAEIHEYPAPVQGAEAAPKIIEALHRADAGNHQIILLVRGGGSLEDLWCFNDEALARCIYSLKTPVITGIGHEIDFTIADYAADLRANTPTGAAEAAVPDRNEIHVQLMHLRSRMIAALKAQDEAAHQQLRKAAQSNVFAHPERLYMQQAMRLDILSSRLDRFASMPQEKRHVLGILQQKFVLNMNRQLVQLERQKQDLENALVLQARSAISREQLRVEDDSRRIFAAVERTQQESRTQLEQNMRLLDAYSPLKVMDRGYSVLYKEGHVVTHVDEVQKGDLLTIRMADGSITAEADGGKHYDE